MVGAAFHVLLLNIFAYFYSHVPPFIPSSPITSTTTTTTTTAESVLQERPSPKAGEFGPPSSPQLPSASSSPSSSAALQQYFQHPLVHDFEKNLKGLFQALFSEEQIQVRYQEYRQRKAELQASDIVQMVKAHQRQRSTSLNLSSSHSSDLSSNANRHRTSNSRQQMQQATSKNTYLNGQTLSNAASASHQPSTTSAVSSPSSGNSNTGRKHSLPPHQKKEK